ncbi:Major facilitator super domain-containing protein 12 [Schistosoma haematobium]|uniref:Major facilitator super domain-containing protein 12 n=1 Tax=Schistosoma haematobium TaxID=6185 RepID=A0A922LKM9_SCHHA|nr:Major facilitator super domain-containing protein 12 [Schistosoma haematobium]KAH9587986.1 Major facilitator super domain-containing protein 12 [Schistosoma haematobium]
MNDIKVSQSLSVIQATTTNKMKWISKIAYGTGQMLKDLVLGFICIFYIIFYEGCISLSSSQVGALLLCGQIANGLATPLIGYLSDRPLGLTEKPTTVHQSITCEDGSVKKDKRLFNRMKRQLRLGQRKSWHLGGCLLMLIAFPLMFGQPEYFVGLPIVVKLLINGMFMICVQVGCAAVQIPHLSIINDLTDQHDERELLASLRYLFHGIGHLATLLITYVFFESEKSSLLLLKSVNETDNNVNNSQLFTKSLITTDIIVGSERATLFNDSINNQSTNVGKQLVVHSEYNITIQDLPIFRNVTLIVVGIGVLFTIIFHCGVREGKPKAHQSLTMQSHKNTTDEFSQVIATSNNNKVINGNSVVVSQLKSKRKRTYSLSSTLPWYAWFTLPRFWLSCSTFSIMRLSVTVSVVYSGPFLLNSLKLNKSSMVSVALVTTISCLITSVGVQRINKLLGNYIGSVVGVLFVLVFCTIAYSLKPSDESLVALYFAAVILGIGNTINNVRALVVIATLIGVKQVHTAAFVHGIASLFDKILTGVFIQCIQLCVPQLTYRHIQVYVVGSLAVFGGILVTIDNFIYSETLESTDAPCLSCFCRRTTSSSPPSPTKFQSDKVINSNIQTSHHGVSNEKENSDNCRY